MRAEYDGIHEDDTLVPNTAYGVMRTMANR